MEDYILSLRNITKSFDEVPVINGISLDVKKGEFITILGPSGCGKTTTLRIIAGLETQDSGQVILQDSDVSSLAPEKRNVNTVFQNYALFPHMNVNKNIAYGLKLKGTKRDEIREKVSDMLALIDLEGYGRRMPDQLSGGQRQRVAIARAVVNNPALLLLDEPLGALDLQLRRQMQVELKSLQADLGITFIYITHDQEEALNMSNRIAIMNNGLIEQIGSPEDIYERPKTRFAAGFIGQSNIIEGTVISAGNDGKAAKIAYNGGMITAKGAGLREGEKAVLSVRAERIHYGGESGYGFNLDGVIKSHSYFGGVIRTAIELQDGNELSVTGANPSGAYGAGSAVKVFWDPEVVAVIEEGHEG
ncbi:MAG: ABC transporter ATP-binding protein [Christensenellales bacterium]|jgi:spermidine/putrescine transport system ATP-binding protein